MRDIIPKIHPDDVSVDENTDEDICRICLQHGDTPLKKRCKCNVNTHDLCIANWIKTRPKGENRSKMRCEVCHSPYIIDESIEKIICEKNKENVELSIEIISSNNDNHSNCHPICILVSLFCAVVIPVWLLYWFVKANEDDESSTEFMFGLSIYLTVGSFLVLVYGTYKDLYGNSNNN